MKLASLKILLLLSVFHIITVGGMSPAVNSGATIPVQVSATLKIGHPYMKSTRARSSNKLQRLDLQTRRQNISLSNERWGNMSCCVIVMFCIGSVWYLQTMWCVATSNVDCNVLCGQNYIQLGNLHVPIRIATLIIYNFIYLMTFYTTKNP